jgi:ubiquinone/menaquinone biosynthesis C-methylase UbiE
MPEFMNRILASQLRRPHGWFGALVVSRVMNRVNRRITVTTLDLLDIHPEHHVLEIGFGGGIGLGEVLRRVPKGAVSGVDISTTALSKAQRRFHKEVDSGRLRLHSGDVCQLPFPDHAFDRVLTINTIYFWPDTAKGMNEIYRVLKPGGVAAVSIRSGEKMRQHGVTKYNFTLFSGEDVSRIMQQSGFKNVRVDHRDPEHWYDQVIVLGTR